MISMGLISPIGIDTAASAGRAGRARSRRIDDIEGEIRLNMSVGRKVFEIPLDDDESRRHGLFRSRARAASKRVGVKVRASASGGVGSIVVTEGRYV